MGSSTVSGETITALVLMLFLGVVIGVCGDNYVQGRLLDTCNAQRGEEVGGSYHIPPGIYAGMELPPPPCPHPIVLSELSEAAKTTEVVGIRFVCPEEAGDE